MWKKTKESWKKEWETSKSWVILTYAFILPVFIIMASFLTYMNYVRYDDGYDLGYGRGEWRGHRDGYDTARYSFDRYYYYCDDGTYMVKFNNPDYPDSPMQPEDIENKQGIDQEDGHLIIWLNTKCELVYIEYGTKHFGTYGEDGLPFR